MKSIKLDYFYFFLLFVAFGFNLTPSFVQAEKKEIVKVEVVEKCDALNKALIKYGVPNFYYHENRNDVGIFYDFAWDDKDKIVKLKRNDGYPIVRFSLFDKEVPPIFLIALARLFP